MRKQMAYRVDSPSRRLPVAALAAAGLVVLIGLAGAMVIFGGQRGDPLASPPPSAANTVADASPTPRASAGKSVPPASSAHESSAPSGGGVAPSSQPPRATPRASGTPRAGDVAPQSAGQFDLTGQVIDIGFPLRSDTTYHYRDNFLDKRDGPPDDYNHAKTGAHGQLVRLHDGIDIYAPENEPVLAPFDGTVIDPASKWQPWEPDRYGLTVVVQSDEPTSDGYTAVLVHLDRVWVDAGDHVSRGQVIGVLGRTGNAENVRPQLHFELRAPFLLDWSSIGEDRQVDAFNPYPSLIEADPKPHE